MRTHLSRRATVAALVASACLAACGGGGNNATPAASITSVKVFGDSLADAGTFGYRFTVQGASSLTFFERVAQAYGQTVCAFYRSADGVTYTQNTACTDYAVGGSRINNTAGPTTPQSILTQLNSAGATAAYKSSDLVLIDGGGNDAADLIGAYLRAQTDGGATYAALLRTQLDATTVGTLLAGGATGLAQAGGVYMKALADTFHATVKAQVLDKGATNVVVMNIPAITKTPRFQAVLAGIVRAQGAAAGAQAEALFAGWISAFNAELAARLNGDGRVVLVDFYTSFLQQVATPAQFSLQNVTTPACPQTGTDSTGLATYTFPTCTDAALSATTPPAGATGGADWWKSYAFADSFHPTPYGHQLVYQLISLNLAQSGRL